MCDQRGMDSKLKMMEITYFVKIMEVHRRTDCTVIHVTSKTRVVARPFAFHKNSCSMLFHVYPWVFHCRFERPLPTSSLDALVQAGHGSLQDCRGGPSSCPAVGIVVFPKVMALNGWGLALVLIVSWMMSAAWKN